MLVGREGADDDAVDQNLEVLLRRLDVAPLGRLEGELVGAGGQAGDDLAERAGLLEEGDLGPLRGVGVAGGEAAAVAGDPGAAGEGPGSARRVVLEVAVAARAHRRRLEPGVGNGRRGHLGQRTSSMKAVLSPPAVSRPWKVIVCAPAATVKVAVVYAGVARARRA